MCPYRPWNARRFAGRQAASTKHMRTKETPLSLLYTPYSGQYRTDPNNCASWADWSGSVVTSVSHTMMVGGENANFHARLKRGELIPYTYYRFFKYEGTSELGYNDYSWTGPCSQPTGWQNRWYYHGNHPLTEIPRWQIVPDELEDLVENEDFMYYVQAAAAKIYSSTWDAGTFTAELHKTIRMVNNAKRRLAGLIVNAIRGRRVIPRSLADIVSLISNNWLEYRYGWRILYYDMLEIKKTIDSLKDKERTRYKDRVGKDWALSSQETWTVSGNPRSLRSTKVDYYNLRCRGMVAADIHLSKARFNIALTTWELIPFSFVIDWFIHVGQAIESMSLVALSSNHTAAWGYYLEGERTVTALDAPISGGSNMTAATLTGSARSECMIKLRTPVNIPIRPHANVRLNLPKSLDLLALIWQMLLRR